MSELNHKWAYEYYRKHRNDEHHTGAFYEACTVAKLILDAYREGVMDGMDGKHSKCNCLTHNNSQFGDH